MQGFRTFVVMRFSLAISILLLFSVATAQKGEIWLDGKFKTGFLAAHRTTMSHLLEQHAFAGEFSYYIQTKGEAHWNAIHRYPSYGITAFFGSVGNRDVLGSYLGVYAFAQFPIIRQKWHRFSFKTGSGVGYGTKVYDAETNPLNVAISTHLNAQVVLGLESRFTFGNHSAALGLDITHFSNGATKVPNLGLNLPYVSLGYAYKMREAVDCDSHPPSNSEAGNSREYGAVAFGTVKETFPVNGKKYGVFGLSLTGRHYFRAKRGVEVTFDVLSNQANMVFHPDVAKTQGELIQMGVFSGYLVPMGRLHLIVGMGVYVWDKFSPDDRFYHRVGTRYVFDNGLNLGVTLKSHWARADYIEYGIGYMFKR